jgi:hypothetical protein
MQEGPSPITWEDALHIGISRCETVFFLEKYFLRWKTEIEEHPKREEIIGAFAARKAELKMF